MIKNLNILEKISFSILILVLVFGIYYANTNPSYFLNTYTKEDGIAEYGTALLLFIISLLLLYRFFKLFKHKKTLWKIGIIAMSLIFLFGAGEEISWGQRIFNISSSDYFLENNAQGETNLHNMVVGGKKINKIIFSQLLTFILIIYLFIIPLFYKKWKWLYKLINNFGVPVVQWHHTVMFVISTILVMLMPSEKKWELYELAFGIIFLLIFLFPRNKFIYKS